LRTVFYKKWNLEKEEETEEVANTVAEAEADQTEGQDLKQLSKEAISTTEATRTKGLTGGLPETGRRQPEEAETEMATATIRINIVGADDQPEVANQSTKNLEELPCTERGHLKADTDQDMMSRLGNGNIGMEIDQF
jgi:hypothetical protein